MGNPLRQRVRVHQSNVAELCPHSPNLQREHSVRLPSIKCLREAFQQGRSLKVYVTVPLGKP